MKQVFNLLSRKRITEEVSCYEFYISTWKLRFHLITGASSIPRIKCHIFQSKTPKVQSVTLITLHTFFIGLKEERLSSVCRNLSSLARWVIIINSTVLVTWSDPFWIKDDILISWSASTDPICANTPGLSSASSLK